MVYAIKLFLFALVVTAVGIGGVDLAYDLMETKEQTNGCSGAS